MDLNKYSSYLSLPPSDLYRAERLVESVMKYHLNHEDMVDEIVENLTGETLEYALKLFVDKTGIDLSEALSYMGVSVAFNGTTYSAPTVGLYGIKSKPEIKSKIKAKVLARNAKENKSKVKKEEVENITEISADTALAASKEADKKRGKLAVAGDKAGAAKKAAQADRLYKKQAAKRLNREESEIDRLCQHLVDADIARNTRELNEVLQTIDEEHLKYFLEKEQELKGKKKGPVIINPKTVQDANESLASDKAKREAILKRKEIIKVAAKKGTVKAEHHQKDENGNTIPHEEINELKTSTLRSYVNRASVDAVGRGVDAGVKGMTGPKKEMEKNMTKAYKRQRGINRAADKLAARAEKNEQYDNTKSPDYDKKKKALAKKHGGEDKIKGHPQYEAADVNSTASVDYSGSPASTPPESAKAKRYPTFKDLQAKIAKAGDPSRGIPADVDISVTSPKGPATESVEPIEEKKKDKKDKPKRWQDNDGDGKWYEKGVDVK